MVYGLVKLFLICGVFLGLGYFAASLYIWFAAFFALTWWFGMPVWVHGVLLVALVLLGVPAIRRTLLSANIMRILEALKLLPTISKTEQEALEAGSIWVDAELFSGKPNLARMMNEPYPKLRDDERQFIENQCAQVCRMVDDLKAYKEGDLSPEVWAYLKKEKFLGLIIPKKYGGREFSAIGHSEVISVLGSSSIPLTISVMVPNSLGPAELLIHYGTQKQKDYYLPRLAAGEELPCFGLTESQAGSDAGSMTSSGVVFRGEDGQLYLRLNWEKRYITLGAAATLLGLAVKLKDPENLLGKGKFPGITCVLVPAGTKGVTLGRRHNPLGVPFINSPIRRSGAAR